jgi:hypothetical protein
MAHIGSNLQAHHCPWAVMQIEPSPHEENCKGSHHGHGADRKELASEHHLTRQHHGQAHHTTGPMYSKITIFHFNGRHTILESSVHFDGTHKSLME